MYVSCSKEALASVGGRQALWATVPEISGASAQKLQDEMT